MQKLALVVTGSDTKEVLERWVFNVENTKDKDGNLVKKSSKPEKQITKEIQAIIRQITASVTFLPLLDEACTFDLLVYTKLEADIPEEWETSDPRYIANSTEIKLRSFNTKIHNIDSMVSYKTIPDEV